MNHSYFSFIICLLSILLPCDVFCMSNNGTIMKTIRASGGIPSSSSIIRKVIFIKASQSSLRYGHSSHSCSGTIISKSYILTAAHCVSSRRGSIASIKICVNTKYERDCKWKFKVDKCIIPRSYSYYSDCSDDIAVCRLLSPMRRNEASEMKLMESSKEIYFDHRSIFFSGAGPVSTTNCRSFYSNRYFNTLQVHLIMYGYRQKSIELSNGMVIRASPVKSGFSKCGAEDGDSGGPLYVLISGIPYLFGVVSSSHTGGYRRNKMTLFSNAYSVRHDILRFVHNSVVSNNWRSIYFDGRKKKPKPYFDHQRYPYFYFQPYYY